MQNEMQYGPHEVKQMHDLPSHLVAMCRDYIDAVNLCMNQSTVKRSRRVWSEILGMKPGTLSLILNRGGESGRRRTFDPDLFESAQRLAGNRGIAQFFDMQIHGQLNHQTTQTEKQALLARIAEIEEQERATA